MSGLRVSGFTLDSSVEGEGREGKWDLRTNRRWWGISPEESLDVIVNILIGLLVTKGKETWTSEVPWSRSKRTLSPTRVKI